MARSRNIKPGFFQNDELAELQPIERLCFIGLWTICDFKGCLEFRPKKIKAQILPYDDVSIEEIAINLDKSGFIRLYSVHGVKYIKIINFAKHQNPHKNEKAAGSDIPDVTEDDAQDVDLNEVDTSLDKIDTNRDQDGTNPADSLLLIPDSLNPITKDKTIDQSSLDREFENIWELYERKGNKKTSKAKYIKLSQSKRDLIANHIPDYVFSTPDKQYRKNFETYINQECWNDEVMRHDQTNRPAGNSEPRRTSALGRVKQNVSERERRRKARARGFGAPCGQPMGEADSDVRVQVCEPIRGDAGPDMGNVYEGGFRKTDC